jgi:hypothetical protein
MDYLIAVDRAKGPNKSAYMARVLNILSSRRKRLSEAGGLGTSFGDGDTGLVDLSPEEPNKLFNRSI